MVLTCPLCGLDVNELDTVGFDRLEIDISGMARDVNAL